MSNTVAKELRREVGLDRDPKNPVLRRLYRRKKKQYTKLNWLEKTNERSKKRLERA